MRFLAIVLTLAGIVQPAAAKQVHVLQTLSLNAQDGVRITGMDLTFSDSFLKEQAESDAKAARKREAEGLPALDPASYPTDQTDPDLYRTLPFKQMFPQVMRDQTREWGLTQGHPVKLRVALEELKTADAAMAILIASSDELSGTVDVIDADTDQIVGRFRVEVARMQSGWGSMLVRGWGVREQLAREFGREVARTLSGKKRKPQTTAMAEN